MRPRFLKAVKKPAKSDYPTLHSSADVVIEQLQCMLKNLKYHQVQGIEILPETWDLYYLIENTRDALTRITRLTKEQIDGAQATSPDGN